MDLYDQCVDQLYGAIGHPERLQPAIAGLRQLFNAGGCLFSENDADTGQTTALVVDGYSDETLAEYGQRWSDRDPGKPAMMASPVGRCAMHDGLLYDPRHSPELAFVNEFAAHIGLRYTRGTKLREENGVMTFFAVQRPRTSAPFGTETDALLDRLHEHLARVSRLMHNLEGGLAAVRAGGTAMETLGVPLLAVTGDGQVRYANPAAEKLLSATLPVQVRHGRLTAEGQAGAVLSRALRSTTGPSRRAPSFSLPCADGRPLLVRLIPVGGAMPSGIFVATPLALVFLSQGGQADADELMQLYGLSSAEAALCTLLARGLRLEDCARKRGVSVSTVRSQLASAFHKTGTTSQGQLVALVLALPPSMASSRG